MGSRRNTRRVTGARPGGFILIQRCTTHDRLRFRGPQHHAPQSGTRRVPALRFRGIMKPFSALSSKLKIIRATASAHSSTSSALPSVATKIDQYPYASLRLRSNVVIGNTRAGRVPPPPQPVSPGYSRSTLRVYREQSAFVVGRAVRDKLSAALSGGLRSAMILAASTIYFKSFQS